MNLVDSSGWLEYFSDGPNADGFAPAVEDMENLCVSAVNLYEVFKRIHQQTNEDDALMAVALMSQVTIVEVNADLALTAAQLSLELGLAMADALILATARLRGATLWTQDEHFKGIDGVRYFPKPSPDDLRKTD